MDAGLRKCEEVISDSKNTVMLAQASIQRYHNLLKNNKKWILASARMTTWAASARFLHRLLRRHDDEGTKGTATRSHRHRDQV